MAISSRTLSLVALAFISSAMIGSTPWRKSQMSLAISTTPMPPATTETRRLRIAPTTRWPMRAAMLASCRRTTSTTVPAMPSLPSSRTWPGPTLAAALAGSTPYALPVSAPTDLGHGRRRSACRGRPACTGVAGPAVSTTASSMRLPISLPTPAASRSMPLDGIGAVDALGRRGRQLLRTLARGQRRPELEPRGFVAHLADGQVDLAVDQVVEVLAPPLVADQRQVVEVGEARLEPLQRQRLDGPAEALLVLRLAGLVLRARHGGRAHGQRLRNEHSGSGEAGDGGSEEAGGFAHEDARLDLMPAGSRRQNIGAAPPFAQN